MTKDEALKLALEALEFILDFSRIGGSYQKYGRHKHRRWVKTENAITAIKEALAQPTSGYAKKIEELIQERDALRALAQPEERNFCQRCGKRTVDLTTIHTCTPPLQPTIREW